MKYIDLTGLKYFFTKISSIFASKTEFSNHTSDTTAHVSTNEKNSWNTVVNKVDKVTGKGLSTNDLTSALKTNYDTAYAHSQSSHAPSDAQKNSDITKAEIEAKLTGTISSHEHTSISGNAGTATKLQTGRTINGVTFDGSSNITITAEANGGNADTLGGKSASDYALIEDVTGDVEIPDVEVITQTMLDESLLTYAKKTAAGYTGLDANDMTELICMGYNITNSPADGGHVYLNLPYDAKTIGESLFAVQFAIAVQNVDTRVPKFRQKNNGTWTAWKTFENVEISKKLLNTSGISQSSYGALNAMAISDYNTLMHSGLYYISATEGALNAPSNLNGYLLVIGLNTGWVMQEYTTNSTYPEKYTRSKSNGVWTPWEDVTIFKLTRATYDVCLVFSSLAQGGQVYSNGITHADHTRRNVVINSGAIVGIGSLTTTEISQIAINHMGGVTYFSASDSTLMGKLQGCAVRFNITVS